MTTKYTDEQLDASVRARLRANDVMESLVVFYWTKDEYHLKRAIRAIGLLNEIDLQEILDGND